MKTVTVLALLLLAMLLAGAVPATVGARPQTQAPAVPVFKEVATQVCTCQHSAQGASPYPETYLPANAFQPAPAYDEQLGTTFTQSFTALAFNVTAVEQTESSSGDGPAYLLNGLTPDGYWYQVGVSWNWNPGTVPGTGFDMNYEVFSPQQRSIFPLDGSGGLNSFSGTVNQGDSILLNLYFSSDQVMMVAHDWNTGASASESFSAEGATSFQGDSQDNANSNGFFTGLMTEWYHSQPFLANEKEVAYTESGSAISSAWLWMDEYNANTRNPQSVFEAGTNGPLTFTSDPTKLQEFSSNGATEYMDASEFISGDMNGTAPTTVPLTLSYNVVGGGSGYSAPVLSYLSGGAHVNATLGTSPSTYALDSGSGWTVTGTLTGSTADERWQTGQPTSGTAAAAQTIALTYYHQYSASVTYSIVGAPPPGPPNLRFTSLGNETAPLLQSQSATIVWMDAGSSYFMSNYLSSPSQQERWEAAGGTNGTVQGPVMSAPTYYQQFLIKTSYRVAGGGSPPSPAINYTSFAASLSTSLSTSPQPLWVDAGSTYAISPSLTSSSLERWSTNTTSGAAAEGLTISPVYQRQYYVELQLSDPEAGALSTPSGWYDAGSSISATASANSGWQFEFWQQGNGPTGSSVPSQVSGPLNETAVFYPGLTITPGNGVTVSYSYSNNGGASGASVSSGRSATVYVPPGGISLSAQATYFLYSFSHWSGASDSASSSIQLTVNSPETLTAVSGYSYLAIGIIAGIVVLLIALVVALASRRPRKTVGSPAA